VHLGGTRMGHTGLMDNVYYKEVHFDLLFFILRIVKPVVTWVQSFKKIREWAELEPHL